MMKESRIFVGRSAGLLAVLLLCSASSCQPADALRQVLGENVLATAATVIQAVTMLVFNTLFGVT